MLELVLLLESFKIMRGSGKRGRRQTAKICKWPVKDMQLMQPSLMLDMDEFCHTNNVILEYDMRRYIFLVPFRCGNA